MAFLKYRGSTTTPTTWSSTVAANAPLSNSDIDSNFASLNAQKLDVTGGTVSSGTLAIGSSATFTAALKDDQVTFVDGADTSKVLAFQLSGITTATTRTLTIPNANGTITLDGHVHAASDVTSGTFATARLGTGTADSTKYLRGDGTWSTIISGASVSDDSTNATDYYPIWTTATTGAPTTVYITTTKFKFQASTGTLSATNFNSLSDARAKTDLAQIKDSLNKVKQLTGYTFTLIEENTRSTGLIAQDVEKVLPEAVGGNEDRKTLNYGALMGLIVEALKDIDIRLAALENK